MVLGEIINGGEKCECMKKRKANVEPQARIGCDSDSAVYRKLDCPVGWKISVSLGRSNKHSSQERRARRGWSSCSISDDSWYKIDVDLSTGWKTVGTGKTVGSLRLFSRALPKC